MKHDRMPHALRGFTLLEMAFVLLVLGIVASLLVPSLDTMHHKSMTDEDRKTIATLRDNLIGQFLATGKLPACKDSAGAVSSTGNCNTAQTLGNLAVRTTDSRNSAIRYDVWNEAATDLTTSDLTNVCSRLTTAISTAGLTGGPSVCHSAPNYDDNGTWTTYCTTTDNVAFVLAGTGLNRDGQSGEVAGSSATVLGNRNIGADRVFENPSRRHDQTWHYDDLVEVVTFQQLLAAANKLCP